MNYITEAPPDDSVGTRVLRTLVTKTINDISYEEMNRIVRRLSRMSSNERNTPVAVADVIAEELGDKKALQYIDKALAAGQIKAKEYDAMRAAILLHMPRTEVTPPFVRQMVTEIEENQRQLREGFKRLTGAGKEAFRKPFEAVDQDAKRLRKSLGL